MIISTIANYCIISFYVPTSSAWEFQLLSSILYIYENTKAAIPPRNSCQILILCLILKELKRYRYNQSTLYSLPLFYSSISSFLELITIWCLSLSWKYLILFLNIYIAIKIYSISWNLFIYMHMYYVSYYTYTIYILLYILHIWYAILLPFSSMLHILDLLMLINMQLCSVLFQNVSCKPLSSSQSI